MDEPHHLAAPADAAPTDATPTDAAPTEAPLGLRERSKLRRRADIQRAGMRLFAERGYDHTTLVDIAEAADLAPRTVSGYFPSKLEIATSFADEIAGRLTATFDRHPDVDLIGAFDLWLRGEAELIDRGLAVLAGAMYRANPGLSALGQEQVSEAAARGDAAVAAWIGRPIDHPIALMCRAALGAALSTYLKTIIAGDLDAGLHESVLAYLRALLDAAAAG